MLFVLLLTLSLAGGALAGWNEDIAGGNSRFETVFNGGDLDEIKKLFASSSDFTFTPGDFSAYNNRDVAQWFITQRDTGITHLELNTAFITNLGDVANERGTYTLTRPDGSVAHTGMYLTSWYMRDAQLKITMAMWT